MAHAIILRKVSDAGKKRLELSYLSTAPYPSKDVIALECDCNARSFDTCNKLVSMYEIFHPRCKICGKGEWQHINSLIPAYYHQYNKQHHPFEAGEINLRFIVESLLSL